MKQDHRQIILASQSPRRKEYLERMGIEFEAIPADIPEPLPQHITPEENAARLSLEKAKAVALHYPDAYVIASDTIVAVDGEQLAKPESLEEARTMLTKLLGCVSTVSTGVVVLCIELGIEIVQVETTEVHFRSLDDPGVAAALDAYLASEDWRDKAGAYGIQSGAGPLIRGIRGEYATIVGLPIEKLQTMLADIGVTTNKVEDFLPDGVRRLG